MDYEQKIMSSVINETIKEATKGIKNISKWLGVKSTEYDIIGLIVKRYEESVLERYDHMRILGMSEPVPLSDIFVRVDILKKPNYLKRVSIEELTEAYLSNNLKEINDTIDSFELLRHQKYIVVLGKPGAGKTTFLKYALISIITNSLVLKKVPVFVNLKHWWDRFQNGMTLLDYITSEFQNSSETNVLPLVKRLLSKGKMLILLDGFDEVSGDVDTAIVQIREFTEKYRKNNYILSCRVAVYNEFLDRFTTVELADFDDQQIAQFIENWFGVYKEKAMLCIQDVFSNKYISELATNPLLLTLLCISFDAGMGFPKNKAELYSEAIDALLKKWDASRTIRRDHTYKFLSTRKKEDLLAYMAANTFEKNEFFLPERTLVQRVEEYMQNIPQNENDEIDGLSVIKSIEAQHGLLIERASRIYSFSHLTFQEYFTAKYIVNHRERGTLKSLNTMLLSPGYREVIILTSGLLPQADSLIELLVEKFYKLLTDLIKKEGLRQVVGRNDDVSYDLFLKYVNHSLTRSEHYTQEEDQDPEEEFSLDSIILSTQIANGEYSKGSWVIVNQWLDEIKTNRDVLISTVDVNKNLIYLSDMIEEVLVSDCYITMDVRDIATALVTRKS